MLKFHLLCKSKYLGLILEKRLTWGPHLINKRKALNSRLHLLRPLLRSNLSLKTKQQYTWLFLDPCGTMAYKFGYQSHP